MNAPRTLRGRLVVAMLAIFLFALAAAALLDASHAIVLPHPLDAEPYQDALMLACFSLPALLLIWLVSSWSLRPLARASREARAVGPQHPAARISRAGMPAEIIPLVDAVNGALDRMTDAFEAERRFTENAAHELRTPLCVLDLRLQQARQSAAGAGFDWPAIEQDIARMNRLVGQLLDLARRENAGRAGAALPAVNLARIGREACAMIVPLAEAHGRALALDLPETLGTRGQADDLREALRNLLENAVMHGQGCIGLVGWESRNPAEIVMIVSDEGPGLPAELESSAFERFCKGRRSEGSGLGLAIVREAVRGHGGTVEFLAGEVCRVRIELPVR